MFDRLGEALTRLREERGWKQGEAAGKAGITQQMLNRYESGQLPKLASLAKILEGWGVALGELGAVLEWAERRPAATAAADVLARRHAENQAAKHRN